MPVYVGSVNRDPAPRTVGEIVEVVYDPGNPPAAPAASSVRKASIGLTVLQ